MLKKGFTTGSCVTAGAVAGLMAIITGKVPHEVMVMLPSYFKDVNKGKNSYNTLTLKIADSHATNNLAKVTVIKDAGDDPDVTHKAKIITEIKVNEARGNSKVINFFAGKGVGTITKAGLKLPAGEAAINPAPREMITKNLHEICSAYNFSKALDVTVSVANGEKLAAHTFNKRLGIIGGISILGTSGIVIPYSCSAWIASLQQLLDVGLADETTDKSKVIAATGRGSLEAHSSDNNKNFIAVNFGPFAKSFLVYCKRQKIKQVDLIGQPAKLAKLGTGKADLSSRSGVFDMETLTSWAEKDGVKINLNNVSSVGQAVAQEPKIYGMIAKQAYRQAKKWLGDDIKLTVIVYNKEGKKGYTYTESNQDAGS